jgi:AcrR family transcriptional regulator
VEAHQAVVAATAALLREGGLPAVTIDTVSARSGVSKPTIYRYWPNRTALAIDVFGEQMTLDVPIADTGDARGDLTEQVRLVARYYNTQAGTVISQLIGACTTDPEARERLRDRFFEGRRTQTRVLWQRAVERGQARQDIDADSVIDILFAPIIFRLLVGHASIDPDALAAIADAALVGLLVTPAEAAGAGAHMNQP